MVIADQFRQTPPTEVCRHKVRSADVVPALQSRSIASVDAAAICIETSFVRRVRSLREGTEITWTLGVPELLSFYTQSLRPSRNDVARRTEGGWEQIAAASTEAMLRDWRAGTTSAERALCDILRLEGFDGIDPRSPFGSPDGGKDFLCEKDQIKFIAACYFPERASGIKKKLKRNFLRI